MEEKMEIILQGLGTLIMENQMDKKIDNDVEAGCVYSFLKD